MIDYIRVQPSVDLKSLEKYVREQVLTAARARDQDCAFARDAYEELHRQGWMQAFVPQELGGPGLPVSDLAQITRRLAYGSSGVAITFIANMLGMGPPLL